MLFFLLLRLEMKRLQPLKFHSVLVPKLWGGTAIAALKGINDAPDRVGESFELSALAGQETFCATAGFEGLSLRMLIERYGADLVGRGNLARYGAEFPLLIKFIDARDALSVQVHPDDEMARRLGMPYGKSEMWYVVDTLADASLLAGFREAVAADDFERLLADGSLMEKANCYHTRRGDAFYIPAGTLHSIGAGNFIIEVQQSSGATYRVYDFDRVDEHGCKRELHVSLAREALCFGRQADCFHHVEERAGARVPVVRSPYFTTEVLRLSAGMDVPYRWSLAGLDSFVVMVCYDGMAILTDDGGRTTCLGKGETLLLPAATECVEIATNEGFSSLVAYV